MEALFHKHFKQRCRAVQIQGVALQVFFLLKAYKQKLGIQSFLRIKLVVDITVFKVFAQIWINFILRFRKPCSDPTASGARSGTRAQSFNPHARLFVSPSCFKSPLKKIEKVLGLCFCQGLSLCTLQASGFCFQDHETADHKAGCLFIPRQN